MNDDQRLETNREMIFRLFPICFPDGALSREIVRACWPQSGIPPKQTFAELADALHEFTGCRGATTPSGNQIGAGLRLLRGRVIGGKTLKEVRAKGKDLKIWCIK